MVIAASFAVVCGEGTTSYGVFDSKEKLKKEYYRVKKILEAEDCQVHECHYKNVEPGILFHLEKQPFVIVQATVPYGHDFDCSLDDPKEKKQSVSKKDFLLVHPYDITDMDIRYSYIRINKFTCSECFSDYDREDFEEHYPNVNVEDLQL